MKWREYGTKSDMTVPGEDLVFISCGQYRKEEIELGKALADAVTDEVCAIRTRFNQGS
jgi:hypothetical protein